MDILGARRTFNEMRERVDTFVANAKSGRPVQEEVDRLLSGLRTLRGQIEDIGTRAVALTPATKILVRRLDALIDVTGSFKRVVDEHVRRSSRPPPLEA